MLNKKEKKEYFLLCDLILKNKKLSAEENNRFIFFKFERKI